MYQRMLISIDAAPDSPDNSLSRTVQFATMAGCSVHLLHVARGHIIPGDISAGSGLGVRTAEDDVDVRERQVVQDAVDTLAAASCRVASISSPCTSMPAAAVILQRAKELDVDIIVLGYQHYRASSVAEQVIRGRPNCSILLARPPQ